MDVRKLAHDVLPYVTEFRRELHKYPEAGMLEFETTKKVAAKLDEMGVTYRLLEPTGLIADVKGKGEGKTVALRADMDALQIVETTDFDFKSENVGIMHACGHDAHTAMLLGAVKVINSVKEQFNGTVRFIFQPGEEVAKGATAVIKQGGLEGVDRIFGVHVGTMRPAGELGSSKGPAYAATDVFKVKINGRACHGAAPHTGMDATVCAAAVIMNLQTMVSREFDPMQPLVVTVGAMASGSRFNIISGQAVLDGTIRSFDHDVHNRLPAVFERIVKKTCEAYRCEAEVVYDVYTSPLINDEESRQMAIASASKIQDASMIVDDIPTMGGEDFSEYLVEVPGAFFNLGVGGNYPLHSDKFEIDESAFEIGVAFHVQSALDVLAQ